MAVVSTAYAPVAGISLAACPTRASTRSWKLGATLVALWCLQVWSTHLSVLKEIGDSCHEVPHMPDFEILNAVLGADVVRKAHQHCMDGGVAQIPLVEARQQHASEEDFDTECAWPPAP